MDALFLIVLVVLIVAAFLFIKLLKFAFKIVFFGIVIVSLFTIASHFTYGYTSVFEGNVRSGANVDIDEYSFIVTMNSAQNQIYIDGLSIRASVTVNTCESKEIFEFCFINVTEDTTETPYVTYVTMNISRRIPDIAVTRTINQTDLTTGQDAIISVNISNAGDTAFDVYFIDDFPEEFEIIDVEGYCKQKGNSMVFERGFMNEGDYYDCQYTIRGLNQFHGSLVAKYNFSDGYYKTYEEKTSALSIDVEPLFAIDALVVREGYVAKEYPLTSSQIELDWGGDNAIANLDEEVKLLINFSNALGEKITVNSLKVFFPPEVDYLGTGMIKFQWSNSSNVNQSLYSKMSSTKIDNVKETYVEYEDHVWNGNVSKMFILEFKTSKSARPNFLITANCTTYDDDELTFFTKSWERFDVANRGVRIRVYLQDKDEMYEPRREIEEDTTEELESLNVELLRVFVENLNPYVGIKNIVVTPQSSMVSLDPFHIDEIAADGDKYTHMVDMILPKVSADTTYKFNVSVKYENDYGEDYTNTTEMDFNVNKFEDLIITHDSSEGLSLYEGEETTWTTTVENPRLVKIKKINVDDSIPDELEVTGVNGRQFVLQKDTEVSAYIYTLKMPKVNVETTYDITTFASYFDWDAFFEYNTSKSTTITVKPKIPDVTIAQSLLESDFKMGDIIPLKYTITNNEETESVFNVGIEFPRQNATDFIGPTDYVIDRIDPGESVEIEDLYNVMMKFNGTGKLEKSKVVFEDIDKNVFRVNSTILSVTPGYAKVGGPMIFLDVVGPNVINKSEKTYYSAYVRNEGRSIATVAVSSPFFLWSGAVPANSFRLIKFSVNFNEDTSFDVANITANYEYVGLTLHSNVEEKLVTVQTYVPTFTQISDSQADQLSTNVSTDLIDSVLNIDDSNVITVDGVEQYSFEEVNDEDNKSSKKSNFWLPLIALVIIAIIFIGYLLSHHKKNKSDKLPFLK